MVLKTDFQRSDVNSQDPLNANFKEIEKMFGINLPWTNMTIETGFTADSKAIPQYCIRNGIYYFRGCLAPSGTNRGYFWKFPTGLEPPEGYFYRHIVAQWSGGSTTAYAARIYADANGLNLIAVETDASSVDLTGLSGQLLVKTA